MKLYNLLPTALLLALRYISSKRKDRFVSFMAFSSVAGIMLGIISLIVVLSVMNGFHSELRERILSMSPHLILSDSNDRVKSWQDWYDKIIGVDEVVAASPIVQQQALVSSDSIVVGVNILGIEPKLDVEVSKLSSIMIEGSTQDLQPRVWNIVLGQELVDKLKLTIGDSVKVIAPPSSLSPLGFVPRIKKFTLSGIFSAGMYEYDSGLAVVNLKDAQLLFQLKDNVSGIQIKTENMFDMLEVKHDIATAIETTAYMIDWRQHHSNLFSAVALEKRMMFIVLTLMIAIAIFNIITSMVMMVNDKQSDIAILRTIGMKARDIRLTFMLQGVIIGTIGVVLGVVIGVLLALNIEDIMQWIEYVFDINLFPADIFYISSIPSELQTGDLLNVSIMSFVLTVLATLYPAHKAANIQPATSLKYE